MHCAESGISIIRTSRCSIQATRIKCAIVLGESVDSGGIFFER